MKQILIAIVFVALTVLSANAQDQQARMEYEKTTELKGLTKIFVDTNGDTDSRNRIIKEFEKAKLTNVVLLDSADNAEIILLFLSGKDRRSTATIVNGTGAAGSYGLSTGKGIAFLPKQPNTMRVILSLDDEKTTWFDKKPAQRFAQEFIKLYKDTNSTKAK